MHVEKGSFQNARVIAELYSAAFPESVELFFGKRTPEELLDLFELTFSLLFDWGIQALLVKDEAGSFHGYCLYVAKGKPSSKRHYSKALILLGRIALQISLPELIRLLRNQVLMIFSVRYSKRTPKHKVEARIVSIAINPACQGQGLGTLLLSSVIQALDDQRIGLNVRTENAPGRRLYKAAGFRVLGTTKDLSGEWLILERPPNVQRSDQG